MKRLAILLLLLASLTAAAQEPTKLVQYLDLSSQKYLSIIVNGEYLTVVVYQDTVDYVALRDPLWSDTAMLSQPFFELNSNDFLHTLHVYGTGRNGVIEIHTKRDNLSLVSRYYNHVYVGTTSDTLRFTQVHVQADDFSLVEFTAPVVADNMVLIAEKSSIIYYHTYNALDYSENTKDNAIIYGGMRNGESLVSKHGIGDYTTDGNKLFKRYYSPDKRLHFSFSAALLNAGGSTMSGLGWTEETYPDEEVPYPTMKTTLGSYQGEMSYDYVCRQHFAMGIGVGYSFSRYKFKDPYVGYLTLTHRDEYSYYSNDYMAPVEPPYGGGDSLQYWSSQLTTHYLTFPLTLTYYADPDHRKGFHVGLTLLPSFGLGKGKLLSRYCQWGVDSEYTWGEDSVHPLWGFVVSDYHNDGLNLLYMTDIRLTIGWSAWSVMVQLSPDWSYSLIQNGALPAYPFRLGVTLSL